MICGEISRGLNLLFFFFITGQSVNCEVEGIMKSKGLGLTSHPGSEICVYSHKKKQCLQCSHHVSVP